MILSVSATRVRVYTIGPVQRGSRVSVSVRTWVGGWGRGRGGRGGLEPVVSAVCLPPLLGSVSAAVARLCVCRCCSALCLFTGAQGANGGRPTSGQRSRHGVPTAPSPHRPTRTRTRTRTQHTYAFARARIYARRARAHTHNHTLHNLTKERAGGAQHTGVDLAVGKGIGS